LRASENRQLAYKQYVKKVKGAIKSKKDVSEIIEANYKM
jgi:hypothetical protein